MAFLIAVLYFHVNFSDKSVLVKHDKHSIIVVVKHIVVTEIIRCILCLPQNKGEIKSLYEN